MLLTLFVHQSKDSIKVFFFLIWPGKKSAVNTTGCNSPRIFFINLRAPSASLGLTSDSCSVQSQNNFTITCKSFFFVWFYINSDAMHGSGG